LRVYRVPFSTNVERVALAAGHKGLEIEWIDVDPADRSAVLAVSGQDLVPVAVFEDGSVVADSMAILDELERRHPELPLYPAEEARRAEMRLFIDWFNRVWKRPPNELEAELRKAQPDQERADALASELAASRDLFEALLAGRAYLFSDSLTAADCAAFPFLKYAVLFDEADEELFHRLLVEHLSLDGAYPRLKAWIRQMDGHPRA
jgi:maleylacetoacetate isomerase